MSGPPPEPPPIDPPPPPPVWPGDNPWIPYGPETVVADVTVLPAMSPYTLGAGDIIVKVDATLGAVRVNLPVWTEVLADSSRTILCLDATGGATLGLESATDKLDGTTDGTITMQSGWMWVMVASHTSAEYTTVASQPIV